MLRQLVGRDEAVERIVTSGDKPEKLLTSIDHVDLLPRDAFRKVAFADRQAEASMTGGTLEVA